MKYAVGSTYPCPNNTYQYTVLWRDEKHLLVSRLDDSPPFIINANGTSFANPYHSVLAPLPTKLWIKRSTKNEFSLHTEEPFVFVGEQLKTVTF